MYELREAFLIVTALSFEAAVLYIVLSRLMLREGLPWMRIVVAAAIAAGVAMGIAASMSPRGTAPKILIPHLENIRFDLALFMLTAAAVMRNWHGRGPDAAGGAATARRAAMCILLPATAFFWLLPESAACVVSVAQRGILEDRESLFRLAILGGAALPIAAAAIISAVIKRAGPPGEISLSVSLCLLFAIKTAGAASWATGLDPVAANFNLFVSNLFHDTFHIFFVMYQLPDHPFLKPQTYQGILYFLSPVTHAVVAAVTATLVVGGTLTAFLRRPKIGAGASPTAREPEKRLAIAARLRSNSRAIETVIVSVLLIWGGIIYAQQKEAMALLDPVPQPVIDDGKGFVVVPLDSMMGDAIPSQMRKYSYSADGREIVFMTIKKKDKSLAIALDMCMICQPDGYAQIDSDRILCKYCKTPIPVSTVGVPGGCNPIPVTGVIVEEKMLRIPRDALVAAFKDGMKGKR